MAKLSLCTLFGLLLTLAASSRQPAPVKGTVTDTKSRPVVQASVYLLNTHFATVTDDKGEFSFAAVPAGSYILRVSAIGYATRLASITVSGNTPLNISLQETASELDAVLVTAQKKDEPLQKVPFSISSLSSQQVNDYRLWNSNELTGIIPNLYAADPGDNRNVTSIRGITSTSYDPAIATYIDGVNQFGLDTYIAQLFDVERIEVLRGPQGTLYGRNAMGGVINIITRQPANYVNGFVSVSIGNYNQQRYEMGIRAPLVKNKLFMGVAGLFDSRDGFYTNQFNNSTFDKQHNLTGNYYLQYLLNNNWQVLLNVKHSRNRNNGTFPLAGSKDEAFENPFVLNQNAVTKMIDNIFNSSLSVNYAGRAFNFSSQTAFQSDHRYYANPIDGDFSPIDGVSIINNYGNDWNNVKVWTQEFRFSSAAAKMNPLKWTTGVYLFAQDNPVKQATHFGDDAGLFGSPENVSIINTSKGKSYGVAVYGQATYAVSSKVDVTLGLRYDYEHKKQSVLSEYQVDPDPDPVFELVPDTSARANFNALTPKVSIAWQATPLQNIYAIYSRGYRAGGLTQLALEPSQPPLYSYKPEFSNNFEIGIKNTLLNNRLRLNIAAFYSTITDAQVPTLVLPDAITITRNTGELTSKGVELELAATPVKGLETGYSFGYTDASYKTLKVAQGGGEVDLGGNKQIFTPEFTSMLAVQYQFPLSEKNSFKLLVRGEWQFLGKQYFDLANIIEQEAYHLFNTKAGISSRHVDIFFWMRNIGDEKYIAYAYDFGAVHLGNPKTFGVTLAGKL